MKGVLCLRYVYMFVIECENDKMVNKKLGLKYSTYTAVC